MEKISVVVPCYNEEESLLLFYDEVCRVSAEMNEQEFEFIFVDDGSKDKTLEILKELHQRDCRVRYISFSRNFGKEAGIYAGLSHTTGDYVAVMDADLQDPPELLTTMFEMIKKENCDCVATRRTSRKGEPPIRSFFSKRFYKFINKISQTEIVDGARDFRLMTRQMTDAILSMGERNRFSKGIFSWVGFDTKWLSYENIERAAGNTKWSFWGLLIYAIDGIVAFSTTPLVVSSIIGIIFFIIALIIIAVIIIKTLIFGDPVAGYPSLVCIIFMIAGIQLFCIGIIGQYLSKVYIEAKVRPLYIIKSTEKDMDTDDSFSALP
ncbi:MAG: glycosyltransferase family 2 protein [Lachnospiraceae bacterium]